MKKFNIKQLLIYSLIFGISITWPTTSSSFKFRVFQSCADVLLGELPQPLIETEQQMRDEGYEDRYIVGLDHARDNLQLAEKLRSNSVDPKTTHIQEFADLIEKYTDFIEEGIHLQKYGDEDFRLQQLELLKSEAQARKNSKTVTLRWWFFFNLRLSIVASPWREHMKGYFNSEEPLEEVMIHEGIESFWAQKEPNFFLMMDRFPERIMIPTIQDLGKISINSTYGTGVHLIGLSDRFQTADGVWMSPFLFFKHDLVHALIRNVDQLLRTKRVMQKIANLQGQLRQNVENLFFELTHEQGYGLDRSLSFNIGRINHMRINEPEGKRIFIKILKDATWGYRLSNFFPWF